MYLNCNLYLSLDCNKNNITRDLTYELMIYEYKKYKNTVERFQFNNFYYILPASELKIVEIYYLGFFFYFLKNSVLFSREPVKAAFFHNIRAAFSPFVQFNLDFNSTYQTYVYFIILFIIFFFFFFLFMHMSDISCWRKIHFLEIIILTPLFIPDFFLLSLFIIY